jgi:two-component system NtrC family sensor kinase
VASIPDVSPEPVSVAVDADALQEINRLRTVARILSNATHDLNNALQVIGGSAELLAMRTELGPAEQRRIQTITTQTGRAAAALDCLMAYTRPTLAERHKVDLEALLRVAISLRDFSLHRARIQVSVERAAPAPCRASVDRRLILQIFLNVLLNAEEALEERRDGSAAIQIRLERQGETCLTSFTDNGPGFSPQARARLADRAAVPSLDARVSGIGLWVAARIAARHGGGLDVDPGPAASVTLRLPSVA